MNTRKVNHILWTMTASFAGAAVIGAALAVSLPLHVEDGEQTSKRPKRPATTQTSPDAAMPVESFASIWQAHFRKDAGEAAAEIKSTSPVQPAANAAAAPFVLVGTIGDSLAMVQSGNGTIELKAVGETYNGAKILAIRPAQVEIEVGGARLMVSRPREPGGG